MKIKLDENLPAALASVLINLGHDVDTVHDEGLVGHVDADVWTAAQKAERFFITQDLDFSDIRSFSPGTHAGVLLVRLNNPGRIALLQREAALFRSEDVDGWQGCFAVVTHRKLRIRRPEDYEL